jgi:serine/threonine-protein kinase
VPHVLRLLRGRHRRDAVLLLWVLAIMSLVNTPDLFGFVTGHSLLDGLHTVSLGVLGEVITMALLLVLRYNEHRQSLERTADELRRQIAERSRELGDALARLATQPQLPLTLDRTIDGRYRVIAKLGAGGMGAVYEVERIADGEHLALKTLRGRADPELMARFAREAQIAAEISHRNLVPVLDVGIADGTLFLVMPLVRGGSLEQARATFGDPRWAAAILRQIAVGLAELHARAIIHRDLKPGNILLAGDVARIADFGLATLRTSALADTVAGSDATAPAGTPLTRAGDVFGTPGYMAPELAAGVDDATPASDVFALGVIAYEMLCGRAPFAEAPVMSRMHGRAIVPPPADGIDPIVLRCLDLDPARRPPASELAAASFRPA